MNERVLLKAHQAGIRGRKIEQIQFYSMGNMKLGGGGGGGEEPWQVYLPFKQSKCLPITEKYKFLLEDTSINIKILNKMLCL